jgi:hypothetical protein
MLSARSDAQQPDDATMAMLGYIMGMASTHYCSCQRWPSSWSELHDFDDKWHANSQSKGEKPIDRMPWAELSRSTVATASDGHLAVSVRRTGTEPIDIGVVLPDCSDFHPEVVAHLCSNPAR